jgi:predicted nucleic acid-binding protein
MIFLVDTNILIYHFNGSERASEFLEKERGRCAISFVTFIEVLSFPNLTDNISAGIREFLDSLDVISVDGKIMETCIKNRKQKKIKLADNIIAATAQTRELTLVTRNTNDFNGLDVKTVNPIDD